MEFDELARRAPAESSAAIKARVDEARAIQNRRSTSNAHLAQPQLEECCALDDSCQKIMRGAFERMGLTARSYDRILRVARTIADLEESESIRPGHLAEALQFRPPEYLRR